MDLFRYKPDDYETKLIILYAIQNLKSSPTYNVLSQVVTGAADINYFEIQVYIDELVGLKSIEEYIVDTETVYTLTPSGEEMCEYFSRSIPASIRQKIEDSAYAINGDTTGCTTPCLSLPTTVGNGLLTSCTLGCWPFLSP